MNFLSSLSPCQVHDTSGSRGASLATKQLGCRYSRGVGRSRAVVQNALPSRLSLMTFGEGYQEADCDCSTMGYARPLPRLSVKRPLLSPKATLRIFIPQKDTTFNCRAPRNNYANEITRGGRGAAKRHFLQHQFSQVIVGGSLQFYREAGAAGSRARQPPTHPRLALLHIQVPAAHHEDRMTIMDKNARQPNENYHQCLSDKIYIFF